MGPQFEGSLTGLFQVRIFKEKLSNDPAKKREIFRPHFLSVRKGFGHETQCQKNVKISAFFRCIITRSCQSGIYEYSFDL